MWMRMTTAAGTLATRVTERGATRKPATSRGIWLALSTWPLPLRLPPCFLPLSWRPRLMMMAPS